MPSIAANQKMWNETYSWPQHGEEWGAVDKPWGRMLEKHFIEPFVRTDLMVLEIGPGHGRWSEILARKAGKLILADLSPNCIAFCREKLKKYPHIEYFVNDGRTLSFLPAASVDLIWSLDAFVHMESDVYEDYFREFTRILKPGGQAVIHHPGKNHLFLGLHFLTRYGKSGNYFYQWLSTGHASWVHWDGWRANVSGCQIRRAAWRVGLTVEKQTHYLEGRQKISVYNDCISVLRKK